MELSEIYRTIQSILYDIANAANGISTGEIVERYDISRRVVPKYITILEDSGVPIYYENKRYYVDENYFVAFKLTPEESELLAISLERSLVHYGANWSVIRSLIHKLNSKMTDSLGDLLIARFDKERGESPADRWFKTLARAKRDRIAVWVDYHPLNRSEPTRWKIRPHRFFANSFSDGLYVLCDGTREHSNYIPLTLKFDRILDVELTTERFGIVEQAQFAERDGHSWGVWSVAQDSVPVTLRFDPRHYDRLLESVWHPTQRISVEASGEVLFSVEVAEPQEMLPWIRSWGAGVTVLEPESLRQRLISGLLRMIDAYGLTNQLTSQASGSPVLWLWAKYNRTTQQYHGLLYHLLDSSAVACVMWDHVLGASQKRWLQALSGGDEQATKCLIAFLVGLHDIGKATPTFQKKASPIYEQLLAAGMADERRTFPLAHGVHSALILQRLLPTTMESTEVDRDTVKAIALAIGGHHGSWIAHTEANQAQGTTGGAAWDRLQRELFDRMREAFDIGTIGLPLDTVALNSFITFLSGFVSVCDWIASNETYFTYQSTDIDSRTYFERSLSSAAIALEELGWHRWQLDGSAGVFDRMFGFEPNALQRASLDVLAGVDVPPRLIMVEYLTGGGKTELALYLTDLLINTCGLSGAYVAMPTQATSNQMFSRVGQYLQSRYADQTVNLQLAHAQSDYHPLFQQYQQATMREGNESGITAERWFHNRKRVLLAPFAVGTVDQAMLSVLQAQHHFVRQYALSHKVVVFDEIHSYDTYMNEIIDRLIQWLTALNAPLILLSATLSTQARQKLLIQAGAAVDALPDVPYPRLTVVDHSGQVQVHALPRPQARALKLFAVDGSIQTLCDLLATIYQDGGCVAVVCNTVDEAISLAYVLREHSAFGPDDVILFHARFPSAWRGGIEQRVLSSFGKDGQRPERAILIATQIIEQSLDLDFDLMITRTAPIDLLIQRAGRLHRHMRQRPSHLQEPVLILRSPELNGDVPSFGVDEAIYARFILLKTWLVVRERSSLLIPDELDAVMDFVYGETVQIDGIDPAYQQALTAAFDERELGERRSAFRGAQHVIAAPGDDSLVGRFSERLPDDDEHGITTRDIRPGVDIICVSGTSDGLLPVLVDRKPRQDEIQQYLQHRITVHKSELVKALKALPVNPHWESIAALRFARPLVFTQGECLVPNTHYRLKLSPLYGLEFVKEKV